MSIFWDASTYNLAFDQLIQFKVSARNVNGWGEASELNTQGATVRTVPRFMNPAVREVTTNDKQIFINWQPISSYNDIGGSGVFSYGLEWDNGTNQVEWSRINGYMFNSLEESYVAQDVVKGTIYNFRLQARNIYGWGAYSEIKAIAAAGIPQ